MFLRQCRQVLKTHEPVYQAIWVDNADFDEVLISPAMIQDHMPDTVLAALNKVSKTVDTLLITQYAFYVRFSLLQLNYFFFFAFIDLLLFFVLVVVSFYTLTYTHSHKQTNKYTWCFGRCNISMLTKCCGMHKPTNLWFAFYFYVTLSHCLHLMYTLWFNSTDCFLDFILLCSKFLSFLFFIILCTIIQTISSSVKDPQIDLITWQHIA